MLGKFKHMELRDLHKDLPSHDRDLITPAGPSIGYMDALKVVLREFAEEIDRWCFFGVSRRPFTRGVYTGAIIHPG